MRRTPLYAAHLDAGARMVPFGGWQMPLHYGSQVAEHHAVRRDAGLFDVSHMAIVDLHGARVRDTLGYLLANDVGRLRRQGRALYSCMLDESGGVVDDLIVYRLAGDWYRLVLNAATARSDIDWIERHAPTAGFELRLRGDLAILALQGPRAITHLCALLGGAPAVAGLQRFEAGWLGDWLVARTGYTGEDGVEIMLPADEAPVLWGRLLAHGVPPAGLGARDTLRLEAGLNLYGADMDSGVTPDECGLGWTVAWEPRSRDFVGRAALRARGEPRRRRLGLVLLERGVLRAGMSVRAGGEAVGVVTSGGFGPTVGRSIALARVAAGHSAGLCVRIRGEDKPVASVAPPFVRNGKSRVV